MKIIVLLIVLNNLDASPDKTISGETLFPIIEEIDTRSLTPQEQQDEQDEFDRLAITVDESSFSDDESETITPTEEIPQGQENYQGCK